MPNNTIADLTADIARERGITVDFAGFEHAMQMQRERARAASKFSMGKGLAFDGQKTEFVGYENLQQDARIVALYKEGSQVDEISAGDEAVIVLDRTPFYAESGGQSGDLGEIVSGQGSFKVEDTQKIQAEVFGHKGRLATGKLIVGETITAKVDSESRQRAAYNHSATHLMHAALRSVLGNHVTQKGSLVNAERTRFDFAHPQALSIAEIHRIEDLVNAEIRGNNRVETRLMKHEDAIKAGAMALFGEKYGDEVRVVGMGEFSTELCGGTHVKRTGDIGLFKVVAEGGVAAGVRRIEAVTGPGALAYAQMQEDTLREAADLLRAQPQELANRLTQIQEQVRTLEKELARYKSKVASSQGDDLAAQAVELSGIKVLAASVEGADAKVLRELADKLRDKLKSCALLLGSTSEGKVSLIAAVTPDVIGRIKAGELVNFVAAQVGGKGGGKPDLAQAGGTQPEKLPAALLGVADWVRGKLN